MGLLQDSDPSPLGFSLYNELARPAEVEVSLSIVHCCGFCRPGPFHMQKGKQADQLAVDFMLPWLTLRLGCCVPMYACMLLWFMSEPVSHIPATSTTSFMDDARTLQKGRQNWQEARMQLCTECLNTSS